MSYIKDHNMYLQRHLAPTNLPIDLRRYRYCMVCGVDAKEHLVRIDKPAEIVQCGLLVNGLLSGKIVPKPTGVTTSNIDEKNVYNLSGEEELKKWSRQDLNYPKEIRINYCPYCGYSHIADHANTIDIDNFFLLAEYSI